VSAAEVSSSWSVVNSVSERESSDAWDETRALLAAMRCSGGRVVGEGCAATGAGVGVDVDVGVDVGVDVDVDVDADVGVGADGAEAMGSLGVVDAGVGVWLIIPA
jgi:hypothetical protein